MTDELKKILPQIHYSSFRYEMDCLKEFHDNTEALLKTEWEKFREKVDEGAKSLTEEEKGDYYDFFIDEDDNLGRRFPEFLRMSNFMFFYSLLEGELHRICTMFEKTERYQIKLNDLADKGIVRSQTFLKKVVGLDFPDQGAQWNDLKDYQWLRNIFAHANGKMKTQDIQNSFQKRFGRNTHIRLNQYHMVEIDKEFIQKELQTINEFLTDIYLKIKKGKTP